MGRNMHPATCYRCGQLVPAGEGHYERVHPRRMQRLQLRPGGKWVTQHAACAIAYRGTNHTVANPFPLSSAQLNAMSEAADVWERLETRGSYLYLRGTDVQLLRLEDNYVNLPGGSCLRGDNPEDAVRKGLWRMADRLRMVSA